MLASSGMPVGSLVSAFEPQSSESVLSTSDGNRSVRWRLGRSMSTAHW
jgi:hypothetical protein